MQARQEYERWVAYPGLDAETAKELTAIKNDEETIAFRFGSPMSFGTAGLRSTMYAGCACMNIYTVAQATGGIAALVKKENGASRGVAIAYDSRNRSKEFAEVCAEVLAASGIRSYLFDAVRPTPELSFAVRELGCIAGINITASHNPKEYNGYKAYWEDGAQLSPEQSSVVAAAIAEQLKYSKTQKNVPSTLWDPLKGLGNAMLTGIQTGDFALKSQLDACVAAIEKK